MTSWGGVAKTANYPLIFHFLSLRLDIERCWGYGDMTFHSSRGYMSLSPFSSVWHVMNLLSLECQWNPLYYNLTYCGASLEKEMAPHSNILAWRIPRTEEPGSQTQLSDFNFTFHFPALEKEMAIRPSVLAWRIPGMGESGGLPSIGSHRVRHDWSNLAAAALWCFLIGK